MILYITGLNQARRIMLPERITGSYQIFGYKDEVIATLTANDNKWNIIPINGYRLSKNGVSLQGDAFDNNVNYTIDYPASNIAYKIYAYNPTSANYVTYEIKKYNLKISKNNADINFLGDSLINGVNLTYNNNIWVIETTDTGIYVGDRLIRKRTLMHGDIIFIDGLKIIIYANYIMIVNYASGKQVSINPEALSQVNLDLGGTGDEALNLETDKSIFNGEEYFTKAPRFMTTYDPINIMITPPPQKQQQQTPPAILTVGPQMTMMLSSALSIFTTLNNVASGKATMASVLPGVLVAVVMMISSFLWPSLTRKWNKRQQKRNELARVKRYRKYLENKKKEIINEHSKEKQVLIENNVSLDECQQIIYNRKRNLWEREITHHDFLNVRLGIGTIPASSIIDYTEADFSTDDDVLLTELKDMVNANVYLEEVPQCISLVEKNTTAVIGVPLLAQKFLNSILLQLMTFHSFQDLKIVIFSNKKNAQNWEYCDILPHCWNNSRTFRYVATDYNEMQSISAELVKEFNARKTDGQNREQEEKTTEQIENSNRDKNSYMNYPPYFLFIIDDLDTARNTEIIKSILGSSKNLGFSILIKNDRISNLPSKCSTFINIDEEMSGLFENELSTNKQKQFKADINNSISMYGCASKLSNIPFELPKEKYDLPKSISFLDMYEVGNIEQLNTSERWKNNNPIASLSVPVGIDQNGNLFTMDIHEKAYGPHGLVAGTTGSGKSEWIITYILSLAVNFNPNEVQFVLIDYKGGGLAGSFENSQVGIRLPHLVGTITNLDKSEVRRAIASIESELKRRQRLFNEAREKLKDSSMNIYKYQDYFRQGLLNEPMSHLFIISDEFAELKSQQPEFLDQLVSTARIGRSLGVHLILATQKPSGVVNDQIWSNSRFKVCLRVAEPNDSNEMLKKPDAAYLKTTGAFYLQVGNDEYYMLGQSAYAGYKYFPSNTVKKKIDQDLHIIDKVANEIYTITEKTADDVKASSQEDMGEELLNILKYVDRISKEENFNVRKLWLDKIPEVIFIDALKKKYNYKKETYRINPVIGEYDDPYTQSQKLYTLPLYDVGNTAIYGAAGSGKELLLLSLIYSLSSTYTLGECNVYVLDCGAQILQVCKNNPIVGNVINGEDADQVDGYFIYMRKILKERKDLFASYGGDYEQFIKSSGKSLPNIIFIINNARDFLERYSEYSDDLVKIGNTCTKYGIYLIITNTQALPLKIAQPFGYKIALNFNTDEEYKNIFPKNGQVFPAKAKSRGIFELNDVIYEFQTAIPVVEDNINKLMEQYNQTLFKAYKQTAPSVPYLPPFVTYKSLLDKLDGMEKVPIGIKKTNIKTLFVNFKQFSGLPIMGNNLDFIDDFVKNLLLLVSNTHDDQIFLFDPKKMYQYLENDTITYVKEGFDEVISNLAVYVNDLYSKLENEEEVDLSLNTYIFINGVEKLLQSTSRETEGILSDVARKMELVSNVHFIFIDTTINLRGYMNTQWLGPFRNNGIFVGPGANEQIVVDIRKFDIKPNRDGNPDDYAYLIQDGKAELFKMIEDIKENEED